MAYISSFESRLTVGFPAWHLGRNLLARHLACGLSNSLLIEALGFFLLLAPCRPDFLAVGGGGGGSVLGLQERLEEIYGDRENDGGVLVDGDPPLVENPRGGGGRGAPRPICSLPKTFGGLIPPLPSYALRPPLA